MSRRRALGLAGGALFIASASRSEPAIAQGRGPSALHLADPAVQQLTVTRARAAPDGFEREIIQINGQFPGPLVRGTLGRPLSLAVKNATDAGITVHSHGQHQRGTWRFDGVPGVTQAPTPPGATWRATYTADPGGTFWYHSHQMSGNSYPDGLFGPLIVDDPEVDRTFSYGQEEVLVINNWEHVTEDELMHSLMHPMHGPNDDTGADIPWVTALVNGRGRYPGGPKVPLTTVTVEKGVPARLRIINASGAFNLVFSIDNHLLEVITVDGQPVSPVMAGSITLEIGSRYDVILRPQADGAHWIRVGKGDGPGFGPSNAYEGRAVLRYKGSAVKEPEPSPAAVRFPQLVPSQLHSTTPANLPSAGVRTLSMVLSGSMRPYVWTIDGQVFPDADPIEISEGEDVRIVMSNPSTMPHPMHLHGHQFYVLGDPMKPELASPPLRDVVDVPSGSAIAIQFKADNPGRWMFHCHVDPHMAAGMARMIDYRGFHGRPDDTFGPPTAADLMS